MLPSPAGRTGSLQQLPHIRRDQQAGIRARQIWEVCLDPKFPFPYFLPTSSTSFSEKRGMYSLLRGQQWSHLLPCTTNPRTSFHG